MQRLSIIRLDTGDLVHSFIGVTGYICWRPDGRAIAYFDVRDEIGKWSSSRWLAGLHV